MRGDDSSELVNSVNALWMHIVYYEAKNQVTLKTLRELHSYYLAVSIGMGNIDPLIDDFDRAVEAALKMSKSERQKKLSELSHFPGTRTVVVNVYVRNPYVVAEVLERASGVCERCSLPAPFRKKKDGSPYLEVHHVIRLADGGEDTVRNAIAVCPNCHRKLHFGEV
jgi:5-methylcytosine-specific restriction protein A